MDDNKFLVGLAVANAVVLWLLFGLSVLESIADEDPRLLKLTSDAPLFVLAPAVLAWPLTAWWAKRGKRRDSMTGIEL